MKRSLGKNEIRTPTIGVMGRPLDEWGDAKIKSELLTRLDYWAELWTNGAMINLYQNSSHPWTNGSNLGRMGR